MMIEFKTYPQAEKAFELIAEGKSFFISGKAGTGKTFLLEEIIRRFEKKKHIVVLAPTGVAAKNAGGVTIHSYLKLPTEPYFPECKNAKRLLSLKNTEKEAIQQTDLILLDEVSMVRCDLLDEMDYVLRQYRNSNKPFGGIQVVLFGDLYQLMPVAKKDEWDDLEEFYDSPYFFESEVIKKAAFPMLELTKVFRQDDDDFKNMLNRIREDKATSSDLKVLRKRYNKNYIQSATDESIRLTTHNYRAKSYNKKMLDSLDQEEYTFKASTQGYYPLSEFPTNYNLVLKEDARVMFVRNIPGTDIVNGTLGTVCYLDDCGMLVSTDDGKLHDVEKSTWILNRYKYNKKSKELEVYEVGRFTQYPLKLAWCITIHKSQGLTFDKVVIDAGKSFANGQVYVALSRCRTLEGITLTTPISNDNIMKDDKIDSYLTNVEKIEVIEEENPSTPAKIEKGELNLTEKKTFLLLKNGYSIAEVAQKRGLAESTIWAHITSLVEKGWLMTRDYVDHDHIFRLLFDLGMSNLETMTFKEIHDYFCGDIPYNEIHVICAEIRRRKREEGR